MRTGQTQDIAPIPKSGSPTKLPDGAADDSFESENSDFHPSAYEDSDSDLEAEEEEANLSTNSLQDSFNRSLAALSISEIPISQPEAQHLEIHDDDSSDEEDTKTRLSQYQNIEQAWEAFISPRVYHNGLEHPLTRQGDGNYSVEIPQFGNWIDTNLSSHNYLEGVNHSRFYIYFGPREYNAPSHHYPHDQRNKLLTAENYNKLKHSFELHYKAIEALYEDRVSNQYYQIKAKKLTSTDSAKNLTPEITSAITKAVNTLVVSINWKDSMETMLSHLHEEVLQDTEVKQSFESLAQEILQKRAFSTRISKDTLLTKLRPFSTLIYQKLLGDVNQVHSVFGSIVEVAIAELRAMGAITARGAQKDGKYWAPEDQKTRKKSYEELVNARHLPKTRLGKFAWSIVKELNTQDPIYNALEAKKEHLLNDFINDILHLVQVEVDAKFDSLKQSIISSDQDTILTILDNIILHNLTNIQLHRQTFRDNTVLTQESFRDIMVNIRLNNRSQRRRIKNLRQDEGDKVWSKTVVWAHGFEPRAQHHALEKETITSNAGRNSLILDFGAYEEGSRKGSNTVTEGIDKLKQDLKIDDKVVAHAVMQILQGKKSVSAVTNQDNEMIYPSEAHCSILINLAGLLILEFKRNPNFTSFMTLDLIRAGKITWRDALDQSGQKGGMLPMSMKDAVKSARYLHDLYSPYLPHPYDISGPKSDPAKDNDVLDLLTREHRLYSEWSSLHQDITLATERLDTARKNLADNKAELVGIRENLASEQLAEAEKPIEQKLAENRLERSSARETIANLGSDTIAEQIRSESPGSNVTLGRATQAVIAR